MAGAFSRSAALHHVLDGEVSHLVGPASAGTWSCVETSRPPSVLAYLLSAHVGELELAQLVDAVGDRAKVKQVVA